MKLVCDYDDNLSKSVETYRGKGAVGRFMKRMLKEVQYCSTVTNEHFNKDIIMTSADRKDFNDATGCHVCVCGYGDGDITVRDYCEVSGGTEVRP